MAKKVKIDTSLLRQLADELDVLLESCNSIRGEEKPDRETVKKYVVEMSKAAGLAAGVTQEATALIMDINHEIRSVQSPTDPMDSLEKLLGLKPPSGGYGGGGFPVN